MTLKAVLIFLLSLLLLTAIAGSLIPTTIAARDVVYKSPPLPPLSSTMNAVLRGGEGKNTDEKGYPRTEHRQPSTHKRASVRREMDDLPQPYPTDPYVSNSPSSISATNPCSYPPCK